jgi:hypothetical protein
MPGQRLKAAGLAGGLISLDCDQVIGGGFLLMNRRP